MAAVLALLTWGVAAGGLALFGWPLASALHAGRSMTIRAAIWFGLLLATLAVLALGLITPLGSSGAAIAICALLFVCALAAWILARRANITRHHPLRGSMNLAPSRILALIAIGASVVYLAVAVAGPVTNYDTGLYHFGAISYAHDYSLIPGLANLFSPFGYSNSLFPLAAFLGNGPWNGEGFRLINGLLVSLLAIDVILRLIRPRLTVGTYVLLVSTGVALIPLVALSDFWVISPSSDPAVMILTFITLAYLSDAIWSKSVASLDAMVAVAAAVIAVSMRPLMAFFLALLVVVLLATWWKSKQYEGVNSKSKRGTRGAWIALLVMSIALAIVQGLRDYKLSGWLEYPLALFSFDVPWKAANPTESQLSTLGYARDPAHMHDVTSGWAWIPSWIERLPTQWEFAIICVLLAVALFVWVVLIPPARRRLLSRALWSAIPAVGTVIVWFLFTPPSFRFAWGPIFGLFSVWIGWGLFVIVDNERSRALWARQVPRVAFVAGSVAVLSVVGFSAMARLDLSGAIEPRNWTLGPLRIPYAVTPVLMPEISTATLESGLFIDSPVLTDQCWARYPLCSPQAPQNLTLIGSDLQSGFMAK